MKKTHTVINHAFCLYLLMVPLLAFMAWVMFAEGDIPEGILFAVLAAAFLGVPAVFVPFSYRFDPKGVTFCYLFLPGERYLWMAVYSVEVVYERGLESYFQLSGEPEGGDRFYMTGKLPKSRRTRKLLEHYWDGTVTGYFWEGLKNRRRTKTQPRQYDTAQVLPMERQARAEAKAALAWVEARAVQLGLEQRTKFYYTDSEEEETNSRPKGKYTYCVLVQLSQPGETDENRILEAGADLLRVRLGKTAYRGVKEGKELPVLQEQLRKMLEEVSEKGFDSYLS